MSKQLTERRSLILLARLGLVGLLGMMGARNLWSASAPSLDSSVADPYFAPTVPRPHTTQKHLNLRIINHGTSVDEVFWRRQLNGVEKIYSLCEGIDFHVNVVSQVNSPATLLSETLVAAHGGNQILGRSFLDFFSPWIASRAIPPEENVIDVHWVDYLNAADRIRYNDGHSFPTGGYAGQAFNLLKLDRDYIFDDSVPHGLKASQIAGNTLVLAVTGIQQGEENAKKIAAQNSGSAARESSVLAHEIGHLLMNFDILDKNGNYISHACPGVRDYCPRTNFLSSGGAEDLMTYSNGQIQSYSPLAQIEPKQCEILKSNSWVYDSL